eukprot:9874004-Alexandrium_andersonii.AAC.1
MEAPFAGRIKVAKAITAKLESLEPFGVLFARKPRAVALRKAERRSAALAKLFACHGHAVEGRVVENDLRVCASARGLRVVGLEASHRGPSISCFVAVDDAAIPGRGEEGKR